MEEVFGASPGVVFAGQAVGRDFFAANAGCLRYDLTSLALYLSPAVVYGDFRPTVPWAGAQRQSAEIPLQGCGAVAGDGGYGLRDAFLASVERLLHGRERVAIALSGGLDSAAILAAVSEVAPDRLETGVAVTVDLLSDAGRSAAAEARGLIAACAPECRHVVTAADGDPAALRWDPLGPTLNAASSAHVALCQAAQRHGADLLLVGDGADELLGTPKFLLRDLLGQGRWRALARYLGDVRCLAPGRRALASELFALLAQGLLPRRLGRRLYFALTWTDLLAEPEVPRILAPDYRQIVADWTRDWLARQLAEHPVDAGSWAAADRYDSLFPHDVIADGSAIPEASPFLSDPFAGRAWSLAAADLFSEGLPTPYQRRKARVVDLIRPDLREHLPAEKATYTTYFRQQARTGRIDLARGCALGLFVPGEVDALHERPEVQRLCCAIEAWIRGAEARGARPA